MRLFSLFWCGVGFVLCLTAQIWEARAWGLPKTPSAPGSDYSDRSRGAGIKEVVPKDTRQRYENWKAELLSTEFGRLQWKAYAERKDFLLTIVVSRDRKFGAGTDDFEWDDEGNLIAARITLGRNLDKGYPDPVYYPVMNSLAAYNGLYEVDGDILASAKIIHEIAHVNYTAESNAATFRRQNKLMESYNDIFLRNGYNIGDPRLVALANELGAKPIEIWEDREYRSEVSAMQYLVERMNGESASCSVFSRMKRNISFYARNYSDKFTEIVNSDLPPCVN